MRNMKTRFLVTSHGMTASHWFASCLNTHPAIYCSHDSSDVSNGKETYSLKNDEQYKRHLPVKQLFLDSVQYTGDKHVIGNVAGFILNDLYQKIFKEKYDFSGLVIANMIRHPVTYINSFVAFALETKHSNSEIYQRRFGKATNYLSNLARDFKISNFNSAHPEIVSFVQACHSCTKIARDMNYGDFIHIKMENLTTDKKYFNSVAQRLTLGQYSFSETMLNDFFKRPLASHKYFVKKNNLSSKSVSYSSDSQKIYAAWEQWKKDIFIKILYGIVEGVGHRTIKSLYEEQGYDLSFIH